MGLAHRSHSRIQLDGGVTFGACEIIAVWGRKLEDPALAMIRSDPEVTGIALARTSPVTPFCHSSIFLMPKRENWI